MEYLLLELADGMFRSLAPRHHVAQVPNLRRRKRGSSPSQTGHLKEPCCWRKQCFWTWATAATSRLPKTFENSLPHPKCAESIWSLHHVPFPAKQLLRDKHHCKTQHPPQGTRGTVLSNEHNLAEWLFQVYLLHQDLSQGPATSANVHVSTETRCLTLQRTATS